MGFVKAETRGAAARVRKVVRIEKRRILGVMGWTWSPCSVKEEVRG